MKYKKNSFIFSSVLIIMSIFLLIFNNFNYGIDFDGGKIIQIRFDKNINIKTIKNKLNSKIKNLKIQKISDNELIFRTSMKNKQNIIKILKDNLKKYKIEIRKNDFVGPKIGNELKINSIIALILSFISILIYISLRFELKFSISAILTLFHDVIIVIGFLILFKIEMNLEIIAAILTVIGYSLNDTIIVFDRLREKINNNLDNNKINLEDIINISLNKTLTRTTLTSLTTLFVVVTLMIFGSHSIFGFTFTIFIGIIIGTYSSIFISTGSLFPLGFSLKKYKENIKLKLIKKKQKEEIRKQIEFGVL